MTGLVAVGLAACAGMALAAGAGAGATHKRPVQIDLSRAPGPQTEASIVIDPGDPRVLLAASQNGFDCAIRVYGSRDGGDAWSSGVVASPHAAQTRRDPSVRGHICAGNEWVGIGADGAQYLAFVARDVRLSPPGYTLFVSTRASSAAVWSAPVRVDPSSAGDDDKPALLADASAKGTHRGRVYLAWTRRDPLSVVVSHSDDHGGTWSAPQRVGAGWGAHLAQARDGTLYLAWWNESGRLEISKSTDGGGHFTAPRRFRSLLGSLDLGVGAVAAMRAQLVHPDPALAVDASAKRYAGRLYAAYSIPTRHGRGVLVSILRDDLKTLFVRRVAPANSSARRDAFNASVAVDQITGTVWACFYLTGSGRNRIQATYSCSTSTDGGRRWSQPRAVASIPSNEARQGVFVTPTGIDSNYASYEGVVASAGTAHPIWTDTRRLKQLREEIYASVVRR